MNKNELIEKMAIAIHNGRHNPLPNPVKWNDCVASYKQKVRIQAVAAYKIAEEYIQIKDSDEEFDE